MWELRNDVVIFSQTETKRERMKKTMSKMRESKIDLHILIASAVIIIINYYFVLFKIKKRREEKKHFKHCCDIQARSDYICEIF